MLTRKHCDSSRLVDIIEGHLRDAKVENWERDWLTPYVSVMKIISLPFLTLLMSTTVNEMLFNDSVKSI